MTATQTYIFARRYVEEAGEKARLTGARRLVRHAGKHVLGSDHAVIHGQKGELDRISDIRTRQVRGEGVPVISNRDGVGSRAHRRTRSARHGRRHRR